MAKSDEIARQARFSPAPDLTLLVELQGLPLPHGRRLNGAPQVLADLHQGERVLTPGAVGILVSGVLSELRLQVGRLGVGYLKDKALQKFKLVLFCRVRQLGISACSRACSRVGLLSTVEGLPFVPLARRSVPRAFRGTP